MRIAPHVFAKKFKYRMLKEKLKLFTEFRLFCILLDWNLYKHAYELSR